MSNNSIEQPEFLADVQKLQEQINSLKKRLDLVEENREKVRQKIYEKVKSDYESKLQELFDKLQPFAEQIDLEIEGLQEEIQKHQEIVETNQENLEEFQLRFFAGEFGEDEYEPQQAEMNALIDESNAKMTELKAVIQDYQKHLSFIKGEPVEEDVLSDESSDEQEKKDYFEQSEQPDQLDKLEDDDIEDVSDESSDEIEEEEEEEEEILASENVLDDSAEFGDIAVEVSDEESEPEEESEEFADFKPETDLMDEPLMGDSEGSGLMKDTVDSGMIPEEDLEVIDGDIEIASEDDGEGYDWDCIPVLDVVDGDFTGESYTIDKERITMGRGPNNDIQLATDTSVSRHHAQITLEGTKYVLVDLESSNGTSVNGMRISRSVLKPNDEIMIGQSKLIIRIQD